MASRRLDETPSSASKSIVQWTHSHSTFPIMIVVFLLLAIESGLSTFEASHAPVQNVGGCLQPSVAICNFSPIAFIMHQLQSSQSVGKQWFPGLKYHMTGIVTKQTSQNRLGEKWVCIGKN
jgi:hypothetical protein